MKKYRQTIILAISAIIISLFSYLTPPGILSEIIPRWDLLKSLPGDIPVYVTRFTLSFVLFGLIPLCYLRFSGMPFSSIGLNSYRGSLLKDKLFPFLFLLCVIVGVSSAFDAALAGYYPYSKTLTIMAVENNWLYFLLHGFSYIMFYYLPWEIFFRGFLILPFLSTSELENKEITPRMLMIASFQIIPSSMIHFGHPLSETIGAIPFGILCGWLVLRYRSIIPGLLLHITTGVTMDLIITIKSGL